jgi:hypothetical protein
MTDPPQPVLRFRAIALGLVLIPFNSYWVSVMEALKYTGHPTTYSLYYNCICWLLLLTVLNEGVKRVRASWGLSRAELLTIYFMLGVSSALVGHDQAQVLLSMILHAHRYATPENGWDDLFLNKIHPSLLVSYKPTLKAIFEGHASLYSSEVLRGLAKPIFWWSLFNLALLSMFAAQSAMLRRQWADHEKLTFPLVLLPMEMTQPEARLWRNPLMWVGFSLPMIINLVNNLHVVFPGVPEIGARNHYLTDYLTGHPWNAIGWSPLWFMPWAIGLGYLLPLDILFSSWVFFWYWKAQMVIAAALGLGNSKPLAPYVPEQALGAYLGIATIVLWAARSHLRDILRSAFTAWRAEGEEREAMGYRTAVLVHVIALGFLLWFSVHFGMDLTPTLLFFLGYIGITVTILRLRAEFGAPVHDLHFSDPGLVMVHIAGPLAFTPRTLCGFSFYFWFNRAHRSHPGPFFIESIVGAQRAGVSQRKVMLAMGLAVLVGIPAAYWALLASHISEGLESAKIAGVLRGFGEQPWAQLAAWMKTPTRPDMGSLYGIIAGYGVALALFLVRIRFVGFPLHPVGYGISSTWSMGTVWLPLMIAWACKVTIVRYGGLKGYKRFLPLFLGLILGDFICGGIANLIGTFSDFQPYHFLG